MHSMRAHLLVTVSLAAVLYGGSAMAQASGNGAATAPSPAAKPDDNGVQLSEIVVSARRVTEDAQTVPIALTAFAGKELAKADLHDIADIQRLAPGLEMLSSAGGSNGAQYVSIRGLQGVVPYFADIPLNASGLGGFSNTLDINNLEVLNGPQGTLFGLSSNAGAIVIVPNRPSEDFGGWVSASAGTLNRRSLEGAINVPMFDNRVLFRMAAQTFHRDGWVVDQSNGYDYGRQDYYTLRPSLVVKITDNIQNYTLFQYEHNNNGPPAAVLEDFAPATPAQLPIVGFEAFSNGGTFAAFNALRDQALAQQLRLGSYKIAGTSNRCPIASTAFNPLPIPVVTSLPYSTPSCPGVGFASNYLVSNQTTWDINPNLHLKNILGGTWGRSFSAGTDFDQSQLFLVESNPRNNHPVNTPTTWSEELQLSGKYGPLDFVSGVFLDRTVSRPGVTWNYLVAVPSETASMQNTTSSDRSIYAQVNYDLSQFVTGLTLTGGYRYSWDHLTSVTFVLNPTTLAPVSSVGGGNSPAGHADFSSGSYTLSLKYAFSPNSMVYVTNSKGYSAGGLQNVAGFEVYRPDTLNNIEYGVKTTFNVNDDVRLRVNASGYYGWYDDVKVTSEALVTNPATGQQQAVVFTSNAATARVEGYDLAVDGVFGRALDLGGFISYSNDRFVKYPSLNPTTLQPIDLSGTPFSLIPKWKYGLHGAYHLPVDAERFGDVSVGFDFTHQVKMYASPLPPTPTTPGNPYTGLICTLQRTAANGYGPLVSAIGGTSYNNCQPPQTNLDMNLTWNNVLSRRGLTASLVVNNVTGEKRGITNASDSNLAAEVMYVPLPRVYTLKLSYAF